MKRSYLVAALFISAGITGLLSASFISEAATESPLTGDYLFDNLDRGARFLAHVYENDGDLYAMLDIADAPMKLELRDAGNKEYRAVLKTTKDFTVRFMKGDSGEFDRLHLECGTYDLDMTGKRIAEDIMRLREYHARPPQPYAYKKPLEVEGGWEVASLDEVGMGAEHLDQMMNDIYANYDYVHSILIVKDGKLVFEEYMNGWDPLRLHRLQSVTKSVTATLVGLAVREGFIGDLGDPLYEYLPEYSALFDEAKKEITIEHLLTMSAGFDWNELETYYADPEACDAHIAGASGDFIKFVLERPIVNEPGTRWYYNSGYPNMLGYIIEQESGRKLLEFAFEYLFEPIGIRRAYWQPTVGEGRPSCAGGLRLMSRDMARYGQLHLMNGKWGGEQVLPRDFVAASTSPLIETGLDGAYGYFWWTHEQEEFSAYLASGTGGQYIVCIPALNVVVVTTAVYHTDKSDEVVGLLLKYVVPALL
ncbi:MAG: serine hydrolase [bacterium]|jgi:CubicO group peptidase (beta-lactamase class C family)